MPVLADLVYHTVHDVARNGESDAFTPARLRQDKSVDADHTAVGIEKRASAVAGVDRRVGLNVDHGIVGLDLARHGTHDAHGHRICQAKRVAERQHELALVQLFRIAEREERQPGAIDLQDGQITVAVNAHDLRVQLRSRRPDYGMTRRPFERLRELDLDPPSALYDVSVSNDVAIGIDEHTRSG